MWLLDLFELFELFLDLEEWCLELVWWDLLDRLLLRVLFLVGDLLVDLLLFRLRELSVFLLCSRLCLLLSLLEFLPRRRLRRLPCLLNLLCNLLELRLWFLLSLSLLRLCPASSLPERRLQWRPLKELVVFLECLRLWRLDREDL